MAVLDSLMVPVAAAAESIGWAPEHLATLSFAKSVCHRCSQIPPSRRWCHEMYGDPWKQAYGWFPYLAALEGGVHPWQIERFLPNAVPTEVRSDLEDYAPLIAQVRALRADEARDHSVVRSPELKAVARRAQSPKSRVMRHFTSEARVAFGFKRVGEGWVTETMLFRLVQGALPAERLIRHFRGEWLEGLELDIYAPSLNLGIEYQGVQHSSPVAHWGGVAALDRQRERDARKRELCRRAGCTLIEVWPGAELTEISVRAMLTQAGVTVTN